MRERTDLKQNIENRKHMQSDCNKLHAIFSFQRPFIYPNKNFLKPFLGLAFFPEISIDKNFRRKQIQVI